MSIALVAAALVPASAAAKGAPPEKLPLPAGSGGAASGPVSTPGGGDRFLARPMGGRTVVERLRGRRPVEVRRLPGAFVVPAVTRDGLPGGLSGDGRTLVLVGAGPTFGRSHTRLAVLAATTLRPRRVVRLSGDFSFDAISPDGSRLYLIRYASQTDPTDYAVRAYDVGAGRLLPRPIVDPSERDSDEMGGYPTARVMSSDAGWAYTLYSAPDRRPFVHALDTVHGRAVCVDLPGVGIGDLRHGALDFGSGGRRLAVSDGHGTTVAFIDTRSLEASAPGHHPAAPPAGTQDSSLPWVLIGLGAGLAVAVVGLWGMPRLHRRRLANGGG